VPVDTVNRVVPRLLQHGRYLRPSLGIQVNEELNARLTRMLGIEGVIILGIAPGSAADSAGLMGATLSREGMVVPGDIILALDGHPVNSVKDLLARLDAFEIGDTVRLSVLRAGERRETSITLQAGP
jgi:S1-C subfamily serine protease